MATFDLEQKIVEDVPVFILKGYLEKDAGKRLNQLADDLFAKGGTALILEFSACSLVNSPGVAALLELSLKVVDDFKGKLLFVGLDSLKSRVFHMANLFRFAQKAESLSAAISLAKAA